MRGPAQLLPVHLVFLVLLPRQVLPQLFELIDYALLLLLGLLRLLNELGHLLLQCCIISRYHLPHGLELTFEGLLQLSDVYLPLLLVDGRLTLVLGHIRHVRLFIVITTLGIFLLLLYNWRLRYTNLDDIMRPVTLWRRHNNLLLLFNELLILLPCSLHFLFGFLAFSPLSCEELFPVPLELCLEAPLLVDLLALLLLHPPLLLVDLVLQHSLQILLLLLLSLVLYLRDLCKPVHGPRYRRPRVLEGLLQDRLLVILTWLGLH